MDKRYFYYRLIKNCVKKISSEDILFIDPVYRVELIQRDTRKMMIKLNLSLSLLIGTKYRKGEEKRGILLL